MKGITGIALPDGGVCLVGDVPQERCRRAEEKEKGSWPWQAPIMQGDVRCAVAWPERIKHAQDQIYRKGCLSLAVVDPAGMMRVVTMQEFEKVATTTDKRGNMVEGLARMLADVRTWGVKVVVFECDDLATGRIWLEMIHKDSAIGYGRNLDVEPAPDVNDCMVVYKQMEPMIILPMECGADIGRDDSAGFVNPMLKTVAMLASSFRFFPKRLNGDDGRWERWT